jgi:hypothetical protein
MQAAHSGPFENIESAHEYVGLLLEALTKATDTIAQEIGTPSEMARDRHLDALRLVDYKLKTLERHLTVSKRLLTDLRTLRRYLFDERTLESSYTTVSRRRES